jgi:hypothetical protein
MPAGMRNPNSIITGDGPAAFAGVVRAISMSTESAGYAALSTWPTNDLVTTATPPTASRATPFTSHFTGGTSFGTRP